MRVQDIEEFLQGVFQRGARIDIGGRPELLGDGRQGDGFGVQDALLEGEVAHWVRVFGSVLTSPAPLVDGAGAGAGGERRLSNNGSGGGPGGSTSGPRIPQAARQSVRSTAAVRSINDGPVSK